MTDNLDKGYNIHAYSNSNVVVNSEGTTINQNNTTNNVDMDSLKKGLDGLANVISESNENQKEYFLAIIKALKESSDLKNKKSLWGEFKNLHQAILNKAPEIIVNFIK